MASLLSPVRVEARTTVPRSPELAKDGAFVVAGQTSDVLKGFVSYVRQRGRPVLVLDESSKAGQDQLPSTLVLFLGDRADGVIDRLAESEDRLQRLVLVSSFRVHFGDKREEEAENRARLKLKARSTVVLRPSHILSERTGPWSRLAGCLCPLIPERFKSCFLEADELFAVIERALDVDDCPRSGTYTLLGANRTWRSALQSGAAQSPWQHPVSWLAMLLSWTGLGHLAGFLVTLFVPRGKRAWNFDTLYPSNTREMLALYNRFNYKHVKIVGYNNGVVHFGQKYLGKTVVSTIRCNRIARLNQCRATFDAGVTLRQAIHLVGGADKEFYVLPNYSYISVGTPFFVPIHGSASECSTLGDTIESVLLYDPVNDRIVAADHESDLFRQCMYNANTNVLLLRVTYRVKEKTRYFLKQTTLQRPTGEEVLAIFHEGEAANVEIRKSRAANQSVELFRYYTQRDAAGETLEFPKDSIGKVWDKLEGNFITAALFHGLMKRFGYHVELFFTPAEFVKFWQTHGPLPIAKIQLRWIKRDGLPHSPFQRHDCVSADLFMLRKHKQTFDKYIKETFREVQYNPGKHSM
jgi:hypothetical protein